MLEMPNFGHMNTSAILKIPNFGCMNTSTISYESHQVFFGDFMDRNVP